MNEIEFFATYSVQRTNGYPTNSSYGMLSECLDNSDETNETMNLQ